MEKVEPIRTEKKIKGFKEVPFGIWKHEKLCSYNFGS